LKKDILPEIASRQVEGYQGVQLLRRLLGDEVEFIVMMEFESMDAVKFTGEDYGCAYMPPKARELFSRFDHRAQHYQIREIKNF